MPQDDSIIITKADEFDKNKELEDYKKRHGLTIVDTNEPGGKFGKFNYHIICAECNRRYPYIVDSDAELELVLQQLGWRSSTINDEVYCPACVEKAIRQELLDKNKKA